MRLEDYTKVRDIQLDVDLLAPPEERWKEAIDTVGDEICTLLEALTASIQASLPELPPVWQAAWKLRRAPISALASTISFISSRAGLEYAREIRSIANACDLPGSEVLLANLTYDLVQLRENFIPTACSSFSCTTSEGYPVLARNLDWGFPEGLGRHTVVIRFHRKRDEYLAIGIPGMVGILSAMRSGHWAMTLNQAPVSPRSIRPGQVLQTPVTQRLRAVCDRFGSYRTFLARLQEYQTMTPFFAHVIGTRPDQQAVVQGFGASLSRRAVRDDVLIQTNHYVEPDEQSLNPPEAWIDSAGIEWVTDSVPRYNALKRRLKLRPRDLSAALAKLRRPPVTHDYTIQSMAFCPATAEWMLRVPA